MVGAYNTNPMIQLPASAGSIEGITNQYTLTPEQKHNQEIMQQNYDMSLGYVKDYYSAAVEGMQKAGLNPAMMFNSGVTAVSYGGAGNAPYNNTDTTSQRYYNKTTANANTVNAASNLINSFSNLFGNLSGGKTTYSYTNNANNIYSIKGFK